MEKKESFYITTAIHYANAGPHLGHAYEGVLADIIARYKREWGVYTYFLSGTDEHGDKILRAAKAAEMGPQVFVDQNAQKFKDLYTQINLSNDDFIRTSDKDKHWPGAIAMWKAIEANGDLYTATYKGLYCVGCESFKTEKDLVDGKCPDHDKEPEQIEEENIFFKLSKYTDQIIDLIESDTYEIVPKARKNEMLAIAKEGLEDVSFSRPERDILWGIPVPDGSNQNMYVWCDALSNYVSALGYGTEDVSKYDDFWPADVHIVGKDILRFHALIWPAMLLSAGLPLPKKVWVHGMITSEGRKMSKSIGNVVDPIEYIESYGVDALRYYLAREISPFEDGDFSKPKFIEVYNANLANGLGNLLSRTLKMAEKYFDGKVERTLTLDVPLKAKREVLSGEQDLDGYTIAYVLENEILPQYKEKMEALDVQQASDIVWKFIGMLDGFITDYEPFKLIKEDPEKTQNIVWNVLYGLDAIAKLVGPFMPDTAVKMWGTISKEGEGFSTTPLEKPLFERIVEEK
jgi:methionyl-tRNA synthetase